MTSIVIGTAGHIDHGKSALVRSLTGTDPDHAALDRLKDEQARGITIDLGFAHLAIGDVQLAFIDVPGHERFVRNMLAGAGGIDAVLFVVAATESVMPQTREHFEICRLLGIGRGVIALTKADVADAGAIARSVADVRALVAGSFLADAPVIPVSARSGQGLDALRAALVALAGHPPRQHRAGVARLPVDRVFTAKGFGAVVTGTLVSGALAVGDTIAVLPDSTVARIRGLQMHGQAVDRATAPARVAVNVAGVDAVALHRGHTLAAAGSLSVTRRADVRLHLLGDARPLAHGARVRLHHGTAEGFARVSIAAVRHRADAEWMPAVPGDAHVTIGPGGEAFARLRFEQPAVITRGDRLIIRAASPVGTIGGAVVLDPEPRTGGVRRASALDRFVRLNADDAADAAGVLLADTEGRGLTADDLVRRGGLDPERAQACLVDAVTAGSAMAHAGRVFAAPVVQRARARVESELARFHRDHPDETGIPRETLRARVAVRTAGELVDGLLQTLATDGVIRGTDRVALATHAPVVSSEDATLRVSIETRLRLAGLAPPDASTLSAELGAPAAGIEEAIRALTKDGRVARLAGIAFHRDALASLRSDVSGLRAGVAPGARVTVDVATFKARHGLSRKHAIPLLEWLDRERVTRRVGDVRIVL